MTQTNAEKFLKNQTNYSMTENGALGYKTTFSELLDLNFQTASLRHMSPEEISDAFERAFNESPEYATKWLFFLRDIQEGNGERRSFRICMETLANNHPEYAKAVFPLIPVYGRYDDLLCLIGTPLDKEVKSFIAEQLKADMDGMSKNQPVSLLAKWMPSINSSSKETRHYALNLADAMGLSNKDYRKMLSGLREYIGVLEQLISAGAWDKIDYTKVPAKANMKYDKAFINHDRDRRLDYFKDVLLNNGKLNVSGIAPYEIIHKLRYAHNSIDEITPELMWEVMKEKGYGEDMGFKDAIVVTDVSGSMTCQIDPKSQITALDVAEALSIYFSEQLQGIFKDKAITFSAYPEFIDMSSATTLKEKLRILDRADWGMNTNIEAVFDMLLEMAIDENVPAEEMPKQIVIISDMEFDEANRTYDYYSNDGLKPITESRLFDYIGEKYKAAGYELPKLVFWNVNSRTHSIPMIENDRGIALLSGFSQNSARMVNKNPEEKDPLQILLKHLDSDRYKAVDEALKGINEKDISIEEDITPTQKALLNKIKKEEPQIEDIDTNKSLEEIYADIGDIDISIDDDNDIEK